MQEVAVTFTRSVSLLLRYVNPASTASERNAESGFVNKVLGESNSATYEWINNSVLASERWSAYLAIV